MVGIKEGCMGILERKEREKTERRKMIMDCAKALILSHGVDGVSMEDIAQKAELAKATLYLYFPSKEVLFRTIGENLAKTFGDYLRPFLGSGISGLEALKRYWTSYLDLFGETDEMIVLLNMQHFFAPVCAVAGLPSEKSSRPSTPHSYVFFDLLKEMVEQGKAEGTFEPDLDSAMAARTILFLFSCIVTNVAKVPREERKSTTVINEMRNIFQIMLRGIAREGIDRSCLVLP
jgi:AcrR family transcriptional regulator